MTNTSSFARLRLLIRKQWIENRKIFVVSTVILFGAVALYYLLAILGSNFIRSEETTITLHNAHSFFSFSSLNFRLQVLLFSSLFYLTLLSGHYFLALGKPSTAIQELTLPVSATERTVVAFLLSTLVIILTFVLTFLLVDALFVITLKAIYRDFIRQADEIQPMFQFTDSLHGFPYILQALDRPLFIPIPIIAFILSSVFTLGSVCFTRYSYVRTAFATMGILVLLAIFYVGIKNVLFAGDVQVSDNDGKLDSLFIGSTVVGIVAIWFATYFRLKEKEV